jgi:hypothetical protein
MSKVALAKEAVKFVKSGRGERITRFKTESLDAV